MLIWTNFDSFAITYLSSSLQMIINSKVQMTMAISENIEKKKKNSRSMQEISVRRWNDCAKDSFNKSIASFYKLCSKINE